ncbi:antibiotic biosynthesis monooxygenase family protein [Phenylobacterium terrae]|uniref:Antibiotic biosynthesis monooxygenase family protein n=1 Tax=Phenylobacterium terrae TaxID=2665495 RepID=A0ABW4N651_9CAUL
MIAVIFEVEPAGSEGRERYLQLAGELGPLLQNIEGFISVERFQSLTNPGKILSLSFFRDEAAVLAWRSLPQHRLAQTAGRGGVFDDYRLRIAEVARDYGLNARDEAPPDSNEAHGLTS